MTLTALTRLCRVCGGLVAESAASCPRCSSVPCPLIEEWPAEVAPWLSAMHMAFYFAPLIHHTRQYRGEFQVRNVIAGHTWGGQLVRLATPAAECLPYAIREAARWAAAGKPREAVQMLTLARVVT